LVNNKASATGIGVYASELFNQLHEISPNNIDMLSVLEGSNSDEPSVPRMLRHLSLFWKMPRKENRLLVHFLSPNLGMGVALRRPCIFTLWDLASFVPSLNRQRVALSKGRDLPMLMAVRFNTSLVRYSNLVICPTHSTASEAARFLKLGAARTRVIYPGVNHDVFRPRPKLSARKILNLPLNKKIILNVSVDEPRKNLSTLLLAFKRLSDRHTDAILIRIGKNSETTRRLVQLLGLQDRIVQVESPRKLSPLYYNAADVLAFPSLYEGVGFPLLESMASGCPIVASNVSSIPEILGNVGLTGAPFDADGFAGMLSRFLSVSNCDFVEDEVSKGLERSKSFDWKACARQTYALYEQLLS
jgi:glycosyltransferase involved in cell wall biosynthesis